MRIKEKCKAVIAGICVMALAVTMSVPVLAQSPANSISPEAIEEQNAAVTPEQVEALIGQIGTVTRNKRSKIVKALEAYNQLDDAGKAAVSNFSVLAEAQQILGIQDALAKCTVKYDEVDDDWMITSPHFDDIKKRLACALSPMLYVGTDAKSFGFGEMFFYIGKSKMDIDTIVLRGGEYKYTYTCGYDNSDYGYDRSISRWWAGASFVMEDSEVDWLRNLLSADKVIMRFKDVDGGQYDYTWTAQDRQAITDIVYLYDLFKTATPEVIVKALKN